MIEIKTQIVRPDTKAKFDVVIQVPENGDEYREVAVTLSPAGSKEPIADVLVTIDPESQSPRVYVSANGNGDTHPISILTARPKESAVSIDQSQ